MDVRICLCMIVKNEQSNIKRCLNPTKDLIDYVFISDTGSSDRTKELIKDWCKENSIESEVTDNSWKNFGHNRTISTELAMKRFPKATHLLFLDADMVLEIEKSFSKESITDNNFMILQYHEASSYWNTRLVSTKYKWRSVGVTHEYWEPHLKEHGDLPHVPYLKLTSLKIKDIGDGGSKSDKFERDLRLLDEGYKTEQDSFLKRRYAFYLARTHEDMKNYTEAIKFYKIRISLGGWDEEIWSSKFHIGLCYKWNEEDFKGMIYWFLEAYDYRPTRAESLYHLIRYYREKKKYFICYCFLKIAIKIVKPDDLLFIDYRIYSYLLLEEMSIVAFYVGKKSKGEEAIKKILASSAPEENKSLARENLVYYQKQINNF